MDRRFGFLGKLANPIAVYGSFYEYRFRWRTEFPVQPAPGDTIPQEAMPRRNPVRFRIFDGIDRMMNRFPPPPRSFACTVLNFFLSGQTDSCPVWISKAAIYFYSKFFPPPRKLKSVHKEGIGGKCAGAWWKRLMEWLGERSSIKTFSLKSCPRARLRGGNLSGEFGKFS